MNTIAHTIRRRPARENVARLGAELQCGFARNAPGNEPNHTDILDGWYGLVYVLQRSGYLTDARGNRHAFRPGSLFQRFPETRYAQHFRKGGGFAECFLVVPRPIFALLLATNTVSPGRPVVEIGLSPDLYERFNRLHRELKICPETELPAFLARAHAFIVELLAMAPPAGDTSRLRTKLADARDRLADDLRGALSLPELARRLGLGYSSFRKSFARFFGLAPGAYRMEKRMAQARILLHQGGRSVKEVAARLGYPDRYVFSKQFKERTGCSPAAFKRRSAAAPPRR